MQNLPSILLYQNLKHLKKIEFNLWWFLTATGNLLSAVTTEMFLEQKCAQAERHCQKGKGKKAI